MIKEHLHEQRTNYVAVVIIGLLVTLPFALLEWATYDSSLLRSSFPIPLFVGMWVAAGVFFYLALSIVRTLRGRTIGTRPYLFGFKAIAAALIAWTWTSLVIDQMPCFLGATGC